MTLSVHSGPSLRAALAPAPVHICWEGSRAKLYPLLPGPFLGRQGPLKRRPGQPGPSFQAPSVPPALSKGRHKVPVMVISGKEELPLNFSPSSVKGGEENPTPVSRGRGGGTEMEDKCIVDCDVPAPSWPYPCHPG